MKNLILAHAYGVKKTDSCLFLSEGHMFVKVVYKDKINAAWFWYLASWATLIYITLHKTVSKTKLSFVDSKTTWRRSYWP